MFTKLLYTNALEDAGLKWVTVKIPHLLKKKIRRVKSCLQSLLTVTTTLKIEYKVNLQTHNVFLNIKFKNIMSISTYLTLQVSLKNI